MLELDSGAQMGLTRPNHKTHICGIQSGVFTSKDVKSGAVRYNSNCFETAQGNDVDNFNLR